MEKKIIHKTEKGKFIINVSLFMSTRPSDEPQFEYRVMTSFIPKGKRKMRSLSDETKNLPAGVLLKAKLEFWNSIKPL